MALTFRGFREVNQRRDKEVFGDCLGTWSLSDWATALAGETGEFCNLVKKIRRGDFSIEEVRQDLANELVDIFGYLDHTANSLGIDLDYAIAHKFNRVSAVKGFDCVIEDEVVDGISTC